MTIQSHVVEGHTYVTNGDRDCPHPDRCDKREEESYLAYVDRHLADHKIPHRDPDNGTSFFADPEDMERNLGVWCFFFYDKWIQGNHSLGTGSAIIADYEPCWEDHQFLANDTFHPDDLEQDTPWDKREFRLKPTAERRTDGVFKQKKKLTKVRGTQKTSDVKALITFEHLGAYFIRLRTDFRMLCISADRGTARDNYFDPLKQLWESHEGLQRLYGTVEYTRRYNDLMRKRAAGKFVSDEALADETRKVCLLARGSKASLDRMRLRWNIQQRDFSGKTAVSLRVVGVLGSSTGGRWDLIICDDVVVLKNVRTEGQRKRVKEVIAELGMQASGECKVVYVNTPFRMDDASAEIDRNKGGEYHIMYRPAMWYDSHTREPHYYWQRGASCSAFPQGEYFWTPARIAKARSDSNFWSQVMLRLRDESAALFKEGDFIIIDPSEALLEIRAGLGGAQLTDRDRDHMQRENLTVRGFTFVDSADDQERLNGDDSATVSMRFDRWGNICFTHADAGRWDTETEMQRVYESSQFNDSQVIEVEVIGSGQKKWVKASYLDFQRRKAIELDRPFTMPIVWAEGRSMSKEEGIDRMYSYTSTGRVSVLSTIRKEIRDQLIRQFCYRGEEPHDDLADAAARVVPWASRMPRKEKPKEAAQTPPPPSPTGTVRVKVKDLLAALDAGDRAASNWGARRNA